jgi:CheY-like chemotaxis protein
METSTLIDKLIKERKALQKELLRAPSERPDAWSNLDPGPCDPAGKDVLLQVFNRTPAGKLEALRLEVDVLRRARGRRPELFHRPFGTARWISPVLHNNNVVHVLDSGPVKVNGWSPAEKETLAKTCGISIKNLPPALETMTVFAPEHLTVLHQQQQRIALAMGRLLDQPAAPEPASGETSSGISLDVLQPGFADHLGHLFQILEAELPPLPPTATPGAVHTAIRRGRHLVEQLQLVNRKQTALRENISIHTLLRKWTDHLHRETGARFDLKPTAVEDRLIANPHAVNHLLYTLLAGVTDGLHAQGSRIGVSTRNDTLDNKNAIHIEIRDSEGLATFAGVSLAWDEEVLSEQNEASEEYADWVSLAERMDARLRILRENDIITRIELLLPLGTEAGFEDLEPDPQAHQIWMVLENETEAKQLRHMFTEYGAHVHWLRSGKELREHYMAASAPPDLVLLEYLLSDTRGVALRSWVYEQDPDLPVILMSGFSVTHPGIATASNLPSTLYLQKPFDTQTLFDMLHMTLNSKS